MRAMQKIAALVAALAVSSLLVAPANAAWHGHGHYAGGHGYYHGGGHGYYHGHAWHGYRGYAIGGIGAPYYAPYYAPYDYDDYAYGYPYRYGYDDYDPGAAIALSMIGTIANLMAHNAFRHGHYHHRRHH